MLKGKVEIKTKLEKKMYKDLTEMIEREKDKELKNKAGSVCEIGDVAYD